MLLFSLAVQGAWGSADSELAETCSCLTISDVCQANDWTMQAAENIFMSSLTHINILRTYGLLAIDRKVLAAACGLDVCHSCQARVCEASGGELLALGIVMEAAACGSVHSLLRQVVLLSGLPPAMPQPPCMLHAGLAPPPFTLHAWKRCR